MNHSEGHYNKQEKGDNYAKEDKHAPLPSPITELSSAEEDSVENTAQECETENIGEQTPPQSKGPKTIQGMLLGLAALVIAPYLIIFTEIYLLYLFDDVHDSKSQHKETSYPSRRQAPRHTQEKQDSTNAVAAKAERKIPVNTGNAGRQASVPEKKKPEHKASSNPISYLMSIDNIGDISSEAFAYCLKLSSVDIECSSIGSSAFLGCTALEDVKIRKGLTRIGNKAFAECTYLKLLLFPNTLQRIGKDALKGTRRIREISVPYGVREELCAQIGSNCRPKTFYILSSKFFKQPEGLKNYGADRRQMTIYVPDALLVDFCKDPEWILFDQILPLSQSVWYDSKGMYKKD